MADPLLMRTGVHLCVSCTAAVDLDQFLRNDHVCDSCGSSVAMPLAGGHSTGFSPIDRAEVQAEIATRGPAVGEQP